MGELSPCPFCGGGHITYVVVDSFNAQVYCKQCRAAMWSGTIDGATELWNRRTPPPATAKVLKAIRDAGGEGSVFRVHINASLRDAILAEWSETE